MVSLLKRLFQRRELPKKLSYEDARAVLESHQATLEGELAARADAEPEMLYYLAERGDDAARIAVAANPRTPAVANRFLADDVNPEVRAELARKIGRLLPDLLADEREHVCQLTLDTLQRLASDQLPRVRAILAEEIKHLDCVPKAVIDTLARDLDETVSVPIIEYSPLLSDTDLLEIIATARAQSALAAIARRRGLGEGVSDAIVASLDIPAVAALLANPSARIREDALEKVIDHARSIEDWQGPLVMRTDLSLRAVRRIAGFVGSALIEQLSKRRGLDEETQNELKRALRQRLDKHDDVVRSDEDKVRAAVREALRNGALDERYVEENVETGNRDALIECLSVLAEAPRPIIEKIFSSRSAKAITALTWRSGLSMRIGFKIQTMVVKLPADELLPARAGVAFPLSEDEMRWHMSYFGLPEKGPAPS
jgi:uncharacterized protein (DUF2336 family)